MMVSNFSTESSLNLMVVSNFSTESSLNLMMVSNFSTECSLNLMMVSNFSTESSLNLMMVSNFCLESYDGKQPIFVESNWLKFSITSQKNGCFLYVVHNGKNNFFLVPRS